MSGVSDLNMGAGAGAIISVHQDGGNMGNGNEERAVVREIGRDGRDRGMGVGNRWSSSTRTSSTLPQINIEPPVCFIISSLDYSY